MSNIDSRWDSAAAAALSRWSMPRASIKLVSHSENLVYRVDTGNGTFGLRVHRPDYHNRQELVSELQWIAALESAGCSVPTPQPTRDGDWLATVIIDGEAPRPASLVRWADGNMVGSRLETAAQDERLRLLGEIGRTIARVHAATLAWTP
ncbi:MAG: phosphotransferase, partial [Gammaproteobacteria bacterium]|nr:phosphotransferase [Gammaproteobacteria bacterium]